MSVGDINIPKKSGIIGGNTMDYDNFDITNYPNPFTNSTTIQFTLPVESDVVIRVYNIFGQEMKTLVNQRYLEGRYTVKFEGSNLPSGHYMYQMKTSEYSLTKKMILNK